jgi:hypothetical protein
MKIYRNHNVDRNESQQEYAKFIAMTFNSLLFSFRFLLVQNTIFVNQNLKVKRLHHVLKQVIQFVYIEIGFSFDQSNEQHFDQLELTTMSTQDDNEYDGILIVSQSSSRNDKVSN